MRTLKSRAKILVLWPVLSTTHFFVIEHIIRWRSDRSLDIEHISMTFQIMDTWSIWLVWVLLFYRYFGFRKTCVCSSHRSQNLCVACRDFSLYWLILIGSSRAALHSAMYSLLMLFKGINIQGSRRYVITKDTFSVCSVSILPWLSWALLTWLAIPFGFSIPMWDVLCCSLWLFLPARNVGNVQTY